MTKRNCAGLPATPAPSEVDAPILGAGELPDGSIVIAAERVGLAKKANCQTESLLIALYQGLNDPDTLESLVAGIVPRLQQLCEVLFAAIEGESWDATSTMREKVLGSDQLAAAKRMEAGHA